MRWVLFILLAANLVPGFFPGNPSSLAAQQNQVAESGGAKGVVLLSEMGEARKSEQTVSEVDGEEGSCLLVGPLASVAIMERFQAAMQEKGIAAQQMIREVDSGSDYWVHLELQPSARATARLLEELKANGHESFVVSEGDLEGVIALGIYSDEQDARENLSMLTASGYDASIYRMQRRAREYWLLVDGKPGGESWNAVSDVLQLEEVPQKMSRSTCKTVASAIRFQ